MSGLNMCFGLFLLLFVSVLPSFAMQMMSETSLQNLFADQTFVNDDLCSSVINNHPCVKNVLSVLVNHISNNVREIELSKERNLETIEILANQLKKSQEIIVKNQDVIENNQYRIKLLEAKLKYFEMNNYPETSSNRGDINSDKNNNWYHTTNHNSEKSNSKKGDNMRHVIGNSTMKYTEDGPWSESMRQESKVHEKWYDSETWKKLGEILYQPSLEAFSDENFINDEAENARGFPYRQDNLDSKISFLYSTHHNALDTSSTDSQGRNGIESRTNHEENGQQINDIESQSYYEVSDNKYHYPHHGKWRRVGQGIDRTFDVIIGAVQSAAAQGLIASFGLPIATMAAVALGGINFFQNTVQEDVLREHKNLLDGLRRDLDALEIPAAVDLTDLTARVAAAETKLVNVGDSFDSICNALHTTSTTTFCCVNGNNAKMNCQVDTFGALALGIDTSDPLKCDRDAFGDPTANTCGDNFAG